MICGQLFKWHSYLLWVAVNRTPQIDAQNAVNITESINTMMVKKDNLLNEEEPI